ncbi:MAG: 2-amino-4-hydroxy-6-hydroxymethyldihydropteridine diphosphokinase [Desulfobacterales bacterium]|nr:2-amino-4-hydroxy-6-hydroxymethyldihydropteridine diphosphokinase [Desulfobacterales bacterium]
MKPQIVYVCIGSNLGEKCLNCQKAVHTLSTGKDIDVITQSPYYKTEPVDYSDQDWFINGVVKIMTSLDPYTLLKQLQWIEETIGRKKQLVKFGPRVIDIDILLYGDMIINSEQLVIPHLRMHQRRFVLKPLCDIDPMMIHPLYQKTMISLLNEIHIDEQQVEQYICASS